MLANNLNEIRSLGHLLAYLIDELDWPLEDETKPENLTYDYTPEELDLRVPIVVRRLRALTASQPWGILLLDFADKSLSITAIRKVLRGFVQRKRQDEQSDRPAWALEHLLFVCQHRGEEGRMLTFVHFEQPALPGRMPRLSSFGWSEQSKNRTVGEHNLPALRWPKDPKDAAAWLKQWQSAFDVEKVTKEFFDEYAKVFHNVELAIVGVPSDEPRRLYTQRLFNRLLFLYFIQRKGWLEFRGQKNYLRALFDATIAKKENFLNDRLYWTFFHGLNTAGEDRETHSRAELEERRGTVPFLNGGLFDLEDDYDIHEAVTIPNEAFAIILELFERFNFTVSESTPLDIEVAVDPEMLGKVFEELVTGRHESGSYYTPRTIVSFMCREALKHFLAPAESDAAAVARFVDDGDPAMLTAPERVFAALKAVTVCDPACGSGAYLLGMMQELLRLRESLFAVHQKDHRQIYDRKLEIVQNNLYGADLDLFAVNIAKLRLWLSLAVDFGGITPPPLPNLDFKIECGDSLTAPDPKTADNIVRSALIDHADELESLKREFVTAHGHAKKQLKSEIQTCQDTLDRLVPDHGPSDAIDWRIAFIEVFKRGGFDIVVGNPPYVRQEEIKHLKPQLKKIYQCYTGVADLFIYFYERGIKLLKPGGQFAFITSNKWYRSGYGEKLRSFLAAETRLHGLIDFGDAPVFDAIAYPTIVLLERNPPHAEASFRGYTWQPGPPVEEFATIFRKQAFDIPQTSLHKGGWRLEGSAKAARSGTCSTSSAPAVPHSGSIARDGFMSELRLR